jgi:hypothetical protein
MLTFGAMTSMNRWITCLDIPAPFALPGVF